MVLQNILFPSADTSAEEQLYFRNIITKYEINYSFVNKCLVFEKNASAAFDTYFNGFSCGKWSKYTQVKKILLNISIQGDFRVSLLRKEKIGEKIICKFLGDYNFNADSQKAFECEFISESNSGMYCFTIQALSDESVFYGGYYSADTSGINVRKVKIAADICTFKRESFVTKNISVLNSYFLNNSQSPLYDALEVFVSDNANTLDIKALSSEKVHIFYNKNVGGAGGFTRGLIEISDAAEKSGITHALIMDDDIIIEPESIFRTYTFLSLVKPEYEDLFIGGAMLRLDDQYIQVESGAQWNSGDLISLKSGLDLRSCEACLYNEIEEKAQYNAWWYCTVPISVVTDKNLPLPIFIRGDDVEYGLRNIKHLALMNGICVWHEPFENKYASSLYYYILRNRLIDNAIHCMSVSKEQFKEIMRIQVMNEVYIYRYKNAKLLMKGVEDFYKGVDWLMNQDGEKLHKEIMGLGYKLSYAEELGFNFRYPDYDTALKVVDDNSFKHRVVRKLTVNGHKLSNRKACVVAPTVNIKLANVYRANTVFNYDCASQKGFITRKNKEEAQSCIKMLKKLMSETDRNYDNAVKDFRENGKKLMTRSFWNKYLEID